MPACECAFLVFFRACAEVSRSDNINYAELGCIIVSVIICHGYMLIAVNHKVFSTKKIELFPILALLCYPEGPHSNLPVRRPTR